MGEQEARWLTKSSVEEVRTWGNFFIARSTRDHAKSRKITPGRAALRGGPRSNSPQTVCRAISHSVLEKVSPLGTIYRTQKAQRVLHYRQLRSCCQHLRHEEFGFRRPLMMPESRRCDATIEHSYEERKRQSDTGMTQRNGCPPPQQKRLTLFETILVAGFLSSWAPGLLGISYFNATVATYTGLKYKLWMGGLPPVLTTISSRLMITTMNVAKIGSGPRPAVASTTVVAKISLQNTDQRSPVRHM